MYKGVPVPILENALYQRLDDINIQDSVEERLIEDLYVIQRAIDIYTADEERYRNSRSHGDDDRFDYARVCAASCKDQRDTMIKTISYLLGPLYAEYLIDKVLDRINDGLKREEL